MQLQNETIKERTPIKGLLIDWLIIFGTYLFIRVFFALFGLHQNIVILGCCLAVLPYLLGAVYLQKIPQAMSIMAFCIGYFNTVHC